MVNFCVRFLYEVFFELTLCVMINATFVDFDSRGSHVASWVLCLFLALLATIALVCITLLFWKDGAPSVRGTFEKRSFWSSLTWGQRMLN